MLQYYLRVLQVSSDCHHSNEHAPYSNNATWSPTSRSVSVVDDFRSSLRCLRRRSSPDVDCCGPRAGSFRSHLFVLDVIPTFTVRQRHPSAQQRRSSSSIFVVHSRTSSTSLSSQRYVDARCCCSSCAGQHYRRDVYAASTGRESSFNRHLAGRKWNEATVRGSHN